MGEIERYMIGSESLLVMRRIRAIAFDFHSFFVWLYGGLEGRFLVKYLALYQWIFDMILSGGTSIGSI